MLRFHILGVELRFRFWFFVVVALFALSERGVLARYLVLPIVIHECGHLLVMALCGAGIRGVDFTPFSLDIRRDREYLGCAREILISLGGILANLALALVLRLQPFQSLRMMLLIAANLAVAGFNLLPVGALDGGQVVRLLAERFGSHAFAYRLSRLFSLLTLVPLFAVSILLLLRGFSNPTLLLACIYLAAIVVFRE